METAVLFFEIRGRRCALPVESVREVFAAPPTTPVPTAHGVVRGLASVHGQVLPVLDLGVWMGSGGETTEVRVGGDAIVIEDFLPRAVDSDEGETARAALLVDRVLRMGVVDEEQARPVTGRLSFVVATVSDQDGPALLLDAAVTLASVRAALVAGSAP